jgi:hypothetical protein
MNAIEEPASSGKNVVSVLLTGVYTVVQFCSTLVLTIELPTFHKGEPYLTPAITSLAGLVENSLQPFSLLLWPASLLLLVTLFLRGSVFSRIGVIVLALVELWGAVMTFYLTRALAIADGSPMYVKDVMAPLLHFGVTFSLPLSSPVCWRLVMGVL